VVVHVSFFFFFQAEDGIRDFHVTGVQTCALPIYSARRARALWISSRTYWSCSTARACSNAARASSPPMRPRAQAAAPRTRGFGRSEERRVGKEWRAREAGDRGREKTQ